MTVWVVLYIKVLLQGGLGSSSSISGAQGVNMASNDLMQTVMIRRPLNASGSLEAEVEGLSFRVPIVPRRSCLGLPFPNTAPFHASVRCDVNSRSSWKRSTLMACTESIQYEASERA